MAKRKRLINALKFAFFTVVAIPAMLAPILIENVASENRWLAVALVTVLVPFMFWGYRSFLTKKGIQRIERGSGWGVVIESVGGRGMEAMRIVLSDDIPYDVASGLISNRQSFPFILVSDISEMRAGRLVKELSGVGVRCFAREVGK